MVGACLIILEAQPRTDPNRFAADAITPTTMSSGQISPAVVNHQGPVSRYKMCDLVEFSQDLYFQSLSRGCDAFKMCVRRQVKIGIFRSTVAQQW
jgi:hypothetical protein